MKEFFKWLGVNEKVAKVAVWTLITMTSLIIINAFLESINVPYYKITVDNLSKIDSGIAIEYIISWIMVILTFILTTALVFGAKKIVSLAKYSLLYLPLNVLAVEITNYAVSQIFIIMIISLFCYMYSGKKFRYILYSLGSIMFNMIIQGICYLYKARFVDFTSLSQINKFITGLDYYIIMIVIIIAIEIIKKKKGVK